LPPKGISTSIVAILTVVALALGISGGYFVGLSSTTALESQVRSLEGQVTSLQSQISTLQGQITTLTNEKTELLNDKTTLQGQIATLNAQISTLTSDKNMLQARVSSLQSENAVLRANITALLNQIENLKSSGGKTYSVGSVLTTFSGGYEKKTGPAFYIPAGNIKIDVVLTSLGDIRGFYLYLYKVGEDSPTWMGTTTNAGTWTNYVYSLRAGDYYLDVSSVNFNWQVTIYVYG
jgi:prefoldin subunit 5